MRPSLLHRQGESEHSERVVRDGRPNARPLTGGATGAVAISCSNSVLSAGMTPRVMRRPWPPRALCGANRTVERGERGIKITKNAPPEKMGACLR